VPLLKNTGRLRENAPRIITVVLLASLAGIHIHEAYSRSQNINISRASNAVVAILDGNGNLLGTGFFVSDSGHIVTAAHVILTQAMGIQKTIKIKTKSHGGLKNATVISVNYQGDMAILKTKSPLKTVNFLRVVDSRIVMPGDKVYSIGHPGGHSWVVTEGIISKKSFFPPGKIQLGRNFFALWTTAWIDNGSSGGPLLNSKGDVIGMIVAFTNSKIPVAQHTNICVSGTDINRLLESL
jgi:S1-C subfamily serine protease